MALSERILTIDLEIELEKRLKNWAYWMIHQTGYPPKSAIVDIGLPSNEVRYSKPPFPLDNNKADETNGWINIMGQKHPEYKQVLREYYLRDQNLKIWQLAIKLEISKRTFEERLRLARTWLSSCIEMQINSVE